MQLQALGTSTREVVFVHTININTVMALSVTASLLQESSKILHRTTLTWFLLKTNRGLFSLCPLEGSVRLSKAHSSVYPGMLWDWFSAGPQIRLIFDILDDSDLGDGLLDPQSGESSGSVGIPALSHQFPHYTQRLGNKYKAALFMIRYIIVMCVQILSTNHVH